MTYDYINHVGKIVNQGDLEEAIISFKKSYENCCTRKVIIEKTNHIEISLFDKIWNEIYILLPIGSPLGYGEALRFAKNKKLIFDNEI